MPNSSASGARKGQIQMPLTNICGLLSCRACVSPDYDLMTLPSPVFNKFNDAMGGIYSKRSVGDFYLWGYESDVKSG